MGQSRPLNSDRVVQRRLATGPVQCLRCAAEWPTDPALSLACPRCLAAAGEPCRRPLGGNENACIARDVLAMQGGLLSHCAALTWDGRHSKPLPLACEIILRAGTPGEQVFAS
jgi:hypothetical protein